MSSLDLAIVTVAGPGDDPFIRLNIEAICQKNPEAEIPIYVIDNGKFAAPPDGIKSGLDAILSDGVAQMATLPAHYRGSYQHADALNNFFKTQKISQRYVLIIDPDFYVVRKNWIERILDEMDKEKLAFFGAPWHPRWYNKYRYFPCVHFMCIDTTKIDIAMLDFSPDLPLDKSGEAKKVPFFMKLVQLLYFMTLQRKIIGKAKDTGYRIFDSHHLQKTGLLVPVMAVKINFVQAKILQFKLVRYLELLVPDKFSYLPKRPKYYTEKGFSQFSLPDLSALGWEEFMWRRRPFAFHLRRFLRKDRNVAAELEQIKQVFLQQ